MRAIPDLSVAQWRKSSYSDGEPGGECLEVAHGVLGFVPVRDSKTPLAPALIFTTDAWDAFSSAVRSGATPSS
jgi:hypothetical protein